MNHEAKPLSSHLHELADKILGDEWRVLSQIIKHWPAIVGANLAEHGKPASLSFVRRKSGQMARITVNIPGSLAPQFSMQEELMRERINRLMGCEFVEKIIFQHRVGK